MKVLIAFNVMAAVLLWALWRPTPAPDVVAQDPPPAEVTAFNRQGVVLSEPTYHNCDVVRLPEGGYRMYFHQVNRILSALSEDGRTFQIEPGIRVAGHMPCLARLSDGRLRMYYGTGDGSGLRSAVSRDGLAFEVEPGERLSVGAAGSPDAGGLVHPSVIQLPDGAWRLFYDGQSPPEPGQRWRHWKTMSASSKDGLTWTRDPGARFEIDMSGPRGGLEMANGSRMTMAWSPQIHYKAGVWTMYFTATCRPVYHSGIWRARSTDGLNFTVDSAPILTQEQAFRGQRLRGQGGPRGVPQDPFLLATAEGERLYYWLSEEGIHTALRVE